MAKLTMGFGVALALLGLGFFVGTGSVHKTSLIPCAFGLLLLVCGALANSPDAKKRMLWMHIAVTVGLLGFLFPAFRVIRAYFALHGSAFAPSTLVAVEEQAAMAVVCLLFVALCVRSFIAARRERLV